MSEDETCLGKRSADGSYPFKLAKSHHGRLLKVKRTKNGVKMSFTCKMNHRFSLMSGEANSWCKVCEGLLKNARVHANLKGG
jgi:hypothetical protein